MKSAETSFKRLALVEIVPPAVCPECSTVLEESDEGGAGVMTHRCPNVRCVGRVRGTLAFIGGRDVLEIDGLGPEMAARLVATGYARDLAELYEFQAEAAGHIAKLGESKFVELMRTEGFDANLPKMIRSLEKAKTASWERWIKALAIPMIGATLGKAVAESLDLQPQSMNVLTDELALFTQRKVDMFGESKMDAIVDWVADKANTNMCQKLFKLGVRPTPVDTIKVVAGAPLKGIAFCITGEFTEDRDSITKKLVALGASSKSGVSKNTNLLIVGEAAGKSKLSKAVELNIKQVGKDWLAKTLADNGMELAGSKLDIEEA